MFSFRLQILYQSDQVFDVLFFQPQQRELLTQRPLAVKVRLRKHGADVPQGEFQLPQQQYLLQAPE